METPTKAIYDARYYGMEDPPRANYRGYGPNSVPHWSLPLAQWLTRRAPAPFLDLGCAFGHLVRDLNRCAPPKPTAAGEDVVAWGVEWSDTASMLRVTEHYTHADARAVATLFPAGSDDQGFGTVVTMDFLEHFPPEETAQLIRDIRRVTRNGGWSVHLIGAHNPADDLSAHMSDPTHANHESLAWYIRAFDAAGFVIDPELTAELNNQPAWSGTDWNGRMMIFRTSGRLVSR